MGAAWDSAIFRGGADLEALVRGLSSVARVCAAPKIYLHFMTAAEPRPLIVSSELTAFRRKRLTIAREHLANLNRLLFGEVPLTLKTPEVLLAQEASRMIGEAVYLSYSDSYTSGGFIAFAKGEIAGFDLAGWEGSGQNFARGAGSGNPEEALVRGLTFFGWPAAASSVDDLFDAFYGSTSATASFLVKEGSELLASPRRL